MISQTKTICEEYLLHLVSRLVLETENELNKTIRDFEKKIDAIFFIANSHLDNGSRHLQTG